MKNPRSLALSAAFTLLGLLIAAPLSAQTEQALYSFCSLSNCADGSTPGFTGVIFDSAGNLYGAAESGGTSTYYGTVYELSLSNGTWNESVLYNFCSITGCADGGGPFEDRLLFDSSGNIYGTTEEGGAHGAGVVFELVRGSNGTWKEKVLHSFEGTDGDEPSSGLVFDAAGNLYGTTIGGGAHDGGTVFELTPGANGKWKEKVLHSFSGKDGLYPGSASLIFDTAGNLYGVTLEGGVTSDNCNCGTVFELTPGADGSWKEKVLHSFDLNGTDGIYPEGELILDASGNLYGTTFEGGHYYSCGLYCGTVFELIPGASGKWKEKLLHVFDYGNTDGAYPAAGLVFDASGNLYGTAQAGVNGAYGMVYELTPGKNGKWAENILFNFPNVNDQGPDGSTPQAPLTFDGYGNLYSTTYSGGNLNACAGQGCGVVFEISP